MPYKCLIDTGANRSCLATEVFEALPEHIKTKARFSPHKTGTTVTGGEFFYRYEILLQLELGDQMYEVDFIVADFPDPVIIGLDFLKYYRCSLIHYETHNGYFMRVLGNQGKPQNIDLDLVSSPPTPNVHLIKLDRGIRLQPGQKLFLPVRLSALSLRAYNACSNWASFHNEIEKLSHTYELNGYPKSLFQHILKKFLYNKKNPNSVQKEEENDCKVFFKIPYIGTPSLLLKKKLISIFKKADINIKIVFTSFKVRNYFSLKDKTHPILRASCVYMFKCLDDPDYTYIGKSKRHLRRRIKEHSKSAGAIFDHLKRCDTCANTNILDNQFNIIDKANSDFDLQILEALHILSERPSLNKQLMCDGSSFMLNIF